MSIINQMLRDIDKRDKKPENEGSSKPSDVYLPKPVKDKRVQFGIAGGGLAILILLGIWWGTQTGVDLDTASVNTDSMQVSADTRSATNTESVGSENATGNVATAGNEASTSAPEGATEVAAMNGNGNQQMAAANSTEEVSDSEQVLAEDTRVASTAAPSSSPAAEITASALVQNAETETAPVQTASTQTRTTASTPTAPVASTAPSTASSTEPRTNTQAQPQTQREQASSEMRVSRAGASTGGSAEASYRDGLRTLRNGNQPAAMQSFRDALAIDNLHHESRLELAVLLFSRGALNEALQLLAAGQQLAPNFNEFRLVEARIMVRAGESENALTILNGTNMVLPADADLFILRGSLATELGYYGTAVHSYRELVTWRPDRGTWWLGLGYALEMNGEHAEAAEAYRQALRDSGLSQESRRFVLNRREELNY